ncbi:MAG: hypothetical protein RL177_779 [Bacteroidota bacterium]
MNVDALIAWYRTAKRDLPWRATSDPYAIWISEVMSQQTRVDTVIPYYHRFLERFPDVCALANASQHDLLSLWEGLGYYSRARNLHAAAKQICLEHGGQLPSEYDTFLALKGVGPYTAAAVLSIAFGQRHAVMDGNVMRVVCRVKGIRGDIRSASVTKSIQAIVDEAIPGEHPADFNQAMMELGATVCTPKKPACGSCPLSDDCIALRDGIVAEVPFKSPKAKVPHHRIVVGIVSDGDGKLLISRRPDSAMLGGLWEFPGGKVEAGESDEQALARELREELGIEIGDATAFHTLNHAYSHFRITLAAYKCRLISGEPKPLASKELKWVSVDDLESFPFPKANRTLTLALRDERA